MKHIYVTEPDVTDFELAKQTVRAHDVQFTLGTTAFDKSNELPYEAILIRSETVVDNTIKEHFPRLKHVIRIGTGLDNVDMAYCKAENIHVHNAAGANAGAVSEYVVGIMFYVLRRFYKLNEQDLVEWNRFNYRGESMSDQVVGLIGFGNIGRLLHKKLQGFECKGFLVYDPYVKKEDLPEGAAMVDSIDRLLQESTVVSLHVPLLPQTKNLINKDNLSLLQPGAILVNASRGGIVNEDDVLEMLSVADAPFTYVADTIVNEPHGNKKLFNDQSIVITPHIASLTGASERAMLVSALENFVSHL